MVVFFSTTSTYYIINVITITWTWNFWILINFLLNWRSLCTGIIQIFLPSIAVKETHQKARELHAECDSKRTESNPRDRQIATRLSELPSCTQVNTYMPPLREESFPSFWQVKPRQTAFLSRFWEVASAETLYYSLKRSKKLHLAIGKCAATISSASISINVNFFPYFIYLCSPTIF